MTKNFQYVRETEEEMYALLFYRMEHVKGTHVATDDNYRYFSVLINGYSLLYAQNALRADGTRMYKLTEDLALCLGFYNLQDFKLWHRDLQFSRRFLSVKAIQRSFRKAYRERGRYR